MNPPGIEKYLGGYDYYCEKRGRDPSLQAIAKPARSGPVRVSARKADRRERAQKVQALSKRRTPLEKAMREAEKTVDMLTAERDKLVAELEAGGKALDYSSINRRLDEIQSGLESATRAWEEAGLELEKFKAAGGGH